MQGGKRAIDTLSVRIPQSHNISAEKKEAKKKTEEDKSERAAYTIKNAMALLLKPASTTPPNTESTRSSTETLRGE